MKNFGKICYVLGIVIAVGVGASVSLPYNSNPENAGGVNCPEQGYTELDCKLLFSECTSGQMKGVLGSTDGQEHDFKSTGTTSARGNCSGASNCATPQSADLTSQGCGG